MSDQSKQTKNDKSMGLTDNVPFGCGFAILFVVLAAAIFVWYVKSSNTRESDAVSITPKIVQESSQYDSKRAINDHEYALRFAEEGNVEAQEKVGMHYLFGLSGVHQDSKQAGYWLTKAADGGDSLAQVQVGIIHCRGKEFETDVDVPKDLEKGESYLIEAFGSGAENASLMMATCARERGDAYREMVWLGVAKNLGIEGAEMILTVRLMENPNIGGSFWADADSITRKFKANNPQ